VSVSPAPAVVIVFALALAGVGCGGESPSDRPAASASKEAKAPVDRASLSAAKRLVGKWEMRLSEVPDHALTEDFLELKREGLADKVRIEYTFTESSFVLDKFGAGGRLQRRYHYQILSEVDDTLKLERVDEEGAVQEIAAVVKEDKLYIGTGSATVPLFRMKQ